MTYAMVGDDVNDPIRSRRTLGPINGSPLVAAVARKGPARNEAVARGSAGVPDDPCATLAGSAIVPGDEQPWGEPR